MGAAYLEQPAVVDYPELTSEGLGLGEVVGDEDSRGVAFERDLDREYSKSFPCGDIDRRQRLVQQKNPKRAREGPSEGHALALAAGEGRAPGLGERDEPETLKQV